MTEQQAQASPLVVGTTISSYSIRQPAKVEYLPQPDITAHEVARLLPILLRLQQAWYPEDYIPDDLKRHFKIEAAA